MTFKTSWVQRWSPCALPYLSSIKQRQHSSFMFGQISKKFLVYMKRYDKHILDLPPNYCCCCECRTRDKRRCSMSSTLATVRHEILDESSTRQNIHIQRERYLGVQDCKRGDSGIQEQFFLATEESSVASVTTKKLKISASTFQGITKTGLGMFFQFFQLKWNFVCDLKLRLNVY